MFRLVGGIQNVLIFGTLYIDVYNNVRSNLQYNKYAIRQNLWGYIIRLKSIASFLLSDF